jgi:lysophospholipase L1-like esterase
VRKAWTVVAMIAVLAAAAVAVRAAAVSQTPGQPAFKEPFRYDQANERSAPVASESVVPKSSVQNSARLDNANSRFEDQQQPLPEDSAIQSASSELTVARAKTDPTNTATEISGKRGLRILQIGDSHTSADYFSGEVRRRLQLRYGQGATGYMTAGLPHNGDVRSSSLKITAPTGWTYKSLQSSDAVPGNFWLSGYDSVATKRDLVMSFISEPPIPFEAVEIEALREPEAGAIEIILDGHLEKHYELAADRVEPVVIRISAQHANAHLHGIQIKTMDDRKVTIASVSIYNNSTGLTYNSVGFVGATVGILNKMDGNLLASDLSRINPQVIVLSFGTNEAADKNLDIAKYRKTYEEVIEKIRSTLPNAAIVMILPPDFNQLSPGCPKEKVREATCEATSWHVADATGASPSDRQCVWQTPTNLALVRDTQRELAKRYDLAYWDWAALMPSECGAYQWSKMTPPLMSRDHIHFTPEGYRRSADQFLDTLIPIIEKVRAERHTN